ncbi:MAG: hypothetical protein SFU83_08270 [Meiothermus sp.]|nr:hypothetical protein [Meiothermus sp.]
MRHLRYLRYLPSPVWAFVAGMLVGIFLGVALYGWLRGIVTVLFFVGLVALAIWIWMFFESRKREP